VNFQALASALHGSGLAVYAVELPGHDLAADSEPFAPLDLVADRVTDEITGHGLTRVLLWGHSSGTAFAVETARKLERRGVDVARVFLAAQLPGDAADRRAAIAGLGGRTNIELAAGLAADGGYTELGDLVGRDEPGLDAPDAEQIGAAYRHDCVSAHRYLADALDTPPAVRLSAPVTVVVAADDPFTARAGHDYRDWELLATHVGLYQLADGGHNFLRTRAAEAAQAVLRAAGLVISS
jgi:surfactin synthase thioesterase subunit